MKTRSGAAAPAINKSLTAMNWLKRKRVKRVPESVTLSSPESKSADAFGLVDTLKPSSSLKDINIEANQANCISKEDADSPRKTNEVGAEATSQVTSVSTIQKGINTSIHLSKLKQNLELATTFTELKRKPNPVRACAHRGVVHPLYLSTYTVK